MSSQGQQLDEVVAPKWQSSTALGCAIVPREANNGGPSKGLEAMSRRRFQAPSPRRRGDWWTIQVRRDDFAAGTRVRTKTRVRIAPATMPEREARKVAAEYLRPL